MNNKNPQRDMLLSSNFRRYNHRRIHTDIDQPAPKNNNPTYYKAINKEYSRPKFLDSHSNKPTYRQHATKTVKLNNNHKPNLLLSREDYSDSQKSTRPKGSKYQIDGVAGRGTFGVVYYGRVRLTGQKIALKKVLQDKKYKNRQLDILKQIKHPSILQMKDHFFTQEQEEEYLNVVMDYYPENLYQVIKRKELSPLLIKLYAYQILRGLNYLSLLSISHRDIKPQNILVDKQTNSVVICDFGSAKKLVRGEPNIAYICSRCYRAPQLIFGATEYTTQIDMWSTGCVIVQMINGEAPFLGDSQIDQLLQIIRVLGTPSRNQIQEMNPRYDLREYKKFPNVKPQPWNKMLKTDDPLLVDLVKKIMEYSPYKRLTAAEAMQHPYFEQLKDPQNLKILKKYPQLYNYSEEQQISLQKDKQSPSKAEQISVSFDSIQLDSRKIPAHLRKRSQLR